MEILYVHGNCNKIFRPIWPRSWTHPIYITNNIRQIIRYQQNCSFWILIGAWQGCHLGWQPFQTCPGCQSQSKPQKIVNKTRKKNRWIQKSFLSQLARTRWVPLTI